MMKAALSAVVLGMAMAGSAQSFEVLHSAKAGRWEAKVSYPQFLTRTAINAVANPGIEATARRAFRSFVDDAVRFDKEGWMGPEWGLELNSTVGVSQAALVSVMWSGYQYTGGANAQTFFVSRTYGPKDGGWAEVGLGDFLTPGTDKTAFAAAAVLPRLNAIKAERGIEPFDEMTPELAEQFVVTPAGMTWLFSKYDVGAGAEGTYEIKVRWSEMPAGLDRGGIASGLIEAAANAWEVTGNLNWPSNLTMPAGVVAEFRIFEPIADKAAEFLQTRLAAVSSQGQPFRVTFDKSRLIPGRAYQVEARVLVEGEVWMRNDMALVLPSDGVLGPVNLVEVRYPEMERPWMRLTGTVGYRERMAMPAGSVVRFQLKRSSREAGNPVLQQKTYSFTGSGMPYDITFANRSMKAGPHYVEVTLEHGGRVWFRSEPTLVESYGWESPRDFVLRRVGG